MCVVNPVSVRVVLSGLSGACIHNRIFAPKALLFLLLVLLVCEFYNLSIFTILKHLQKNFAPVFRDCMRPRGGGGYFHMYAYWVCTARETPIFSLEFPFRSISFSQISPKSVPEHHHFTFFGRILPFRRPSFLKSGPEAGASPF